jgi:YesN/AraC family two-component response regulator
VALFHETGEQLAAGYGGELYVPEFYFTLNDLVLGKVCGEREIDLFLEYNFQEEPVNMRLQFMAFSAINSLQMIAVEYGLNLQLIFGGDFSAWERIGSLTKPSELRGYLKQLLHRVKKELSAGGNTRNRELVGRIVQIIKKDYTRQLTTEDIAGRIYLSSKQANNIFRQEMQKSIFEYLTDHRMLIAKRLLRETNEKITAIAMQAGYLSSSHFGIIFKKIVGISPREYRDTHRGG